MGNHKSGCPVFSVLCFPRILGISSCPRSTQAGVDLAHGLGRRRTLGGCDNRNGFVMLRRDYPDSVTRGHDMSWYDLRVPLDRVRVVFVTTL